MADPRLDAVKEHEKEEREKLDAFNKKLSEARARAYLIERHMSEVDWRLVGASKGSTATSTDGFALTSASMPPELLKNWLHQRGEARIDNTNGVMHRMVSLTANPRKTWDADYKLAFDLLQFKNSKSVQFLYDGETGKDFRTTDIKDLLDLMGKAEKDAKGKNRGLTLDFGFEPTEDFNKIDVSKIPSNLKPIYVLLSKASEKEYQHILQRYREVNGNGLLRQQEKAHDPLYGELAVIKKILEKEDKTADESKIKSVLLTDPSDPMSPPKDPKKQIKAIEDELNKMDARLAQLEKAKETLTALGNDHEKIMANESVKGDLAKMFKFAETRHEGEAQRKGLQEAIELESEHLKKRAEVWKKELEKERKEILGEKLQTEQEKLKESIEKRLISMRNALDGTKPEELAKFNYIQALLKEISSDNFSPDVVDRMRRINEGLAQQVERLAEITVNARNLSADPATLKPDQLDKIKEEYAHGGFSAEQTSQLKQIDGFLENFTKDDPTDSKKKGFDKKLDAIDKEMVEIKKADETRTTSLDNHVANLQGRPAP